MKAGAPLVALEVALGLILFAGTALTVNSLIRMRTVDLGFEAAGLLPLEVGLGNRYSSAAARYDFFDQLVHDGLPRKSSEALSKAVYQGQWMA